jgi:DNA invertase Pin-like site-specific DNA recombinase
MHKVAILTRVSTLDQSNDRQVTELTEYAKERSWQIVDTVTETVSGATANKKRVGLQKVLELARKKKVNKVLIHEVTRLGRDTSQVLQVLEELHKLGVSVVVKNYQLETLNSDGSVNSMAQFLFTLLADIGRMERLTLKERVKSGMALAKQRGKHIGRPLGSAKTTADVQKEYKKVIASLNRGNSVRETAKQCEVSVSTVQRVKRAVEGTKDKVK